MAAKRMRFRVTHSEARDLPAGDIMSNLKIGQSVVFMFYLRENWVIYLLDYKTDEIIFIIKITELMK